MAETFSLSELIIPGTYIRVQAEALIGVGGVSTGNIGIVGTASGGAGETHLFSEYGEVTDAIGAYDAYDDGNGDLNLARALELAVPERRGHRLRPRASRRAPTRPTSPPRSTSWSRRTSTSSSRRSSRPTTRSTCSARCVNDAEKNGKDLIAVVGADADAPADIVGQIVDNDRAGTSSSRPASGRSTPPRRTDVDLSGTYTAAAVAGLLSTLVPQSSPTNKVAPRRHQARRSGSRTAS